MAVHRLPDAYGRTPGNQGERFPDYDVLDEAGTWDGVTAGVVLARLGPPTPLRFFDPAEEAIGRALLDHLLDQRAEPRIPVLEMIDSRLAEEQTDGWHYEDMPEDGQAWRQSLRGLDADSEGSLGRGFAQLAWAEQAEVIGAVHDLGRAAWHGLPAARVWSLWTRYAAAAFYAHPWAWNEIGFGGPAYPRGYRNLGLDRREPWEVPDAHPERDPVRMTRDAEAGRRRRAVHLDLERADGDGTDEGNCADE